MMAWDAATTRRRGNSIRKSTLSPAASTTPNSLSTASNPHLTDSQLQPFLSANFDPATYLNSTLPTLKPRTSSTSTNQNSRSSTPSNSEANLADLSSQTQTLLSQLSAHTSRLTTTLTELTDAILRGGARLAYEVEVLRGESEVLKEALAESLKEDIEVFVPGGLGLQLQAKPQTLTTRPSTITAPQNSDAPEISVSNEDKKDRKSEKGEENEPEYITQLKTLSEVRARLDTVIHTFDSALSWTFPPSEVSVSSGLISVSAPESADPASLEEKGQGVSRRLKAEITEILIGGAGTLEGIANARKRIEELRGLCEVWKGTAEEKARVRFVDGLAKMVDDKEREIRNVDTRSEDGNGNKQGHNQAPSVGGVGGGYGFINHLQKMRGGI